MLSFLWVLLELRTKNNAPCLQRKYGLSLFDEVCLESQKAGSAVLEKGYVVEVCACPRVDVRTVHSV